MKRYWLALGAAGALAACVVSDRVIAEEFAWLTGEHVGNPNDEFQRRIQILGPIDFGQTTAAIAYHNGPQYRAFTIAAQPGDPIDVWVRSPNGNAAAWLLDATFKVVARNDDANRGTNDAHIVTSVPPGASVAWYIVFRERNGRDATFTVSLAARPVANFFACVTDQDCTAAPLAGCCQNGKKIAVNVNQVNAYESANACNQPRPICPEILYRDLRVAICDFPSHSCTMADPGTIHCGGNIRFRHECPPDYQCKFSGVPDVGGTCTRVCNLGTLQCAAYQHADETSCSCVDNPTCGGIAGRSCPDPKWPRCIDDPRDDCNPAKGGADCGGICVAGCLEKVMCKQGFRFDTNRCGCVPMIMEPQHRPPMNQRQ